MRAIRKINDSYTWIGGNDRRLAMFEGVYSVAKGVSYNSYFLSDEKTVVFDTVDKAVSEIFFENLAAVLAGRGLDYLIVQHMEPDHSATIKELLLRHTETKIITNKMSRNMMKNFFGFSEEYLAEKVVVVAENDTLSTGNHTLKFIFAPMVHWPEVMMTYDETDKILFSADAFGTFGALNGAIFADEVDFERDYLDEARRYYANIVGKYGDQVQAVLSKLEGVDVKMIAPLHGFVWRKNLEYYLGKYQLWSKYIPEKKGVMICYASIYGHTENAAELLAISLKERGIETVMFDVSVTAASEIIAAAFKYSHLVFASCTYNAGIFVSMEELVSDLVAHNIQNRTVTIIENGSWAAASGRLIREKFSACKNLTFAEKTLSIRSAMKQSDEVLLQSISDEIAASFPQKNVLPQLDENQTYENQLTTNQSDAKKIDSGAFRKLSYGLFVLSSRAGEKESGCIINTMQQLTTNPQRVSFALNKSGNTHDMIKESGVFSASILSVDCPFEVFERFGFKSGREIDKLASCEYYARSENGMVYIDKQYANAMIAGRIVSMQEFDTHTLFVAEINEAFVLSGSTSMTYDYYFAHVKPKQKKSQPKAKGWRCKICGYVYEGEELAPDFVCPICKHGAADFEKIQ